jgi:putative transposase
MDEYESLSHTKWDCKYHVVLTPKCRRMTLYVGLLYRRPSRNDGLKLEHYPIKPRHSRMTRSSSCTLAG